jgi:hypothetical protein
MPGPARISPPSPRLSGGSCAYLPHTPGTSGQRLSCSQRCPAADGPPATQNRSRSSRPAAESTSPAASVFRCARCGDGTRLRAWAHVNIHGDVGPDGLIERSDYEDDAFLPILEESVTCKVHGEDHVEKLVGARYVAVAELALEAGRYVSR